MPLIESQPSLPYDVSNQSGLLNFRRLGVCGFFLCNFEGLTEGEQPLSWCEGFAHARVEGCLGRH